jgi:hypothetical protein
MSETEVWTYADSFVATEARSNVFGRGDLTPSQLRSREELLLLTVEADEPPVRHAVIRGWPTDEEQRRSMAQVLGALATCVVRP